MKMVKVELCLIVRDDCGRVDGRVDVDVVNAVEQSAFHKETEQLVVGAKILSSVKLGTKDVDWSVWKERMASVTAWFQAAEAVAEVLRAIFAYDR